MSSRRVLGTEWTSPFPLNFKVIIVVKHALRCATSHWECVTYMDNPIHGFWATGGEWNGHKPAPYVWSIYQ